MEVGEWCPHPDDQVSEVLEIFLETVSKIKVQFYAKSGSATAQILGAGRLPMAERRRNVAGVPPSMRVWPWHSPQPPRWTVGEDQKAKGSPPPRWLWSLP